MAFAKKLCTMFIVKLDSQADRILIVFRIFKIGFQLGSTFDPVLSDGTVLTSFFSSSLQFLACNCYLRWSTLHTTYQEL